MALKNKHKFIAGFLGFLFLCLPLLASFHSVHNDHQYCVEHERFEEASHGAFEAPQNQAEHKRVEHREGSFDSADVELSRFVDAEDDHHDCAFDDFFYREVQLEQKCSNHVSLNVFRFLPFMAAVDVFEQEEILRWAPKNSPPIV